MLRNTRIAAIMFGIAMALICVSPAAFAQAEKGDKELSIAGQLEFPHVNPGTGYFGFGQADVGYYASKLDRLGFQVGGFVASKIISMNVGGSYRHYVPFGNPKVLGFLGGAGGISVSKSGFGSVSTTTTPTTSSSSITTNGQVQGSGGVKFFVSQKVSFDVQYQLEYTPSSGTNSTFQKDSRSRMLVGFSYIF